MKTSAKCENCAYNFKNSLKCEIAAHHTELSQNDRVAINQSLHDLYNIFSDICETFALYNIIEKLCTFPQSQVSRISTIIALEYDWLLLLLVVLKYLIGSD